MSKVAFFILLILASVAATAGDVLSKKDCQQYDVMMKAIDEGDLRSVDSLIKGGTSLGLRIDSRASPTFLTQAAYRGRNEIIKALLTAGADIESVNGDGYTPLMCAVLAEKADTVQLLIDRKANVNSVSFRGETPLSLAKESAAPKARLMVQILIKAGANE